jgi:hypothetical protein
MIKLIILLSLIGVSCLGLPKISAPNNAISMTESVNYIYKYNVSIGTFVYYESGSDPSVLGFPIYYERETASDGDGTFYNYTSGIGNALNYGFNDAPFNPIGINITTTFKKSTTPWDYSSAPYRYFPDATAIIGGASSLISTEKWSIEFDNNSMYDYMIWIDVSSSPTDYYLNIDINTDVTYPPNVTIYDYDVIVAYDNFITYMIPAYSIITFTANASGGARYFDALYFRNIGRSSAEITGFTSGFGEGNTYGKSIGYNSGYNLGYNVGVSVGYGEGLLAGEEAAYDEGYEDGINESFTSNLHTWIVPAIIIVLVAGGFISIAAYKKKES